MTAVSPAGMENFALATVTTSVSVFDASLIVSDFVSPAPVRKPVRVRLPEGLPRGVQISLGEAIRSLFRLRQLEPRWDGGSADILTDDACETAVRLLVALAISTPLTVQIFPLPDGGVQLEWHVGGNDVEIEVDPIGEVHVFISARDGSIVLNEEPPPSLLPLVIPQIKRHLWRMSRLLDERA